MFVFILLLQILASSTSLIYKVSLTNSPSLIHVSMQLSTNRDSISFSLKNKRIRSFIAVYAKNKRRYRVRTLKTKSLLTMKQTKGKKISLGYNVVMPNFNLKYREHSFRDNNFISLFAKDIFLIPNEFDNVTDELRILVKYAFPSMWTYVSSWKNQSGVSEIYNLSDLYRGLIVVGDITKKYLKVRDKLYLFSFYGVAKKQQKSILAIYRKIIEKQIDLWGYLPSDKVLVSIFKSSKVKHLSEGLQFNNVIVHYLSKDSTTDDIELLRLFAHEHFHIWNGSHLKPKTSVENLTWFTEGFTDYYALLTLLQCKLLSTDDLLNILVKRYLAYESQDKAGNLILSLALDLNIILASNGLSTSDDYIRTIETKSKFWTDGYDNNMLKLAFVSVANWDFDDFFDKYIYNHETLELESLLSKFGINTVVKDKCEDHLGYKTVKYKKKYFRVKSIEKTSTAYKEGLRLKDIILDENKDDTGLVRITVLRRRRKKTFSFNVRSCKKDITWLSTNNSLFKVWLTNRAWK